MATKTPSESDIELSDFAKAIEERNKTAKLHVFDVTGLFGPGDRPLPQVAIRVPTKREQDEAIRDAYEYVAEVAGPVEQMKTDADVVRDAKSAAIATRFARNPKDNGKYSLFPGPMWACKNLRPEQIAVLVNLANEVRAAEGPARIDVSDEATEAFIDICDAARTDEIPSAVLAGCSREYLSRLVCALAWKLSDLRRVLAEVQPPAPAPAPEDLETTRDGE